MKLFVFGFITLLATFSLSQASVGGYFCPTVINKFKDILINSLQDKNDILSIYYGAKGLKLLNEPINKITGHENSCATIKSLYTSNNPEIIFGALSAWQLLGCSGKLHTDATLKTLREILDNEKSTTADIRYAAEALTLLNQNIPNAGKVSQNLQARLKEDDNLPSLGQALHAAAILGNAGKFALDRIEDVVVQADEIDGKILQWEGGLSITSLLVTGLYRLPSNNPLNAVQAEKIANYLLTRRTVQTSKGVLALLEAIIALTNSNVSPVSISVLGSSQVSVEKPELKIRVSDLLGRPLKPTPSPIVAQSATRIADDVVVLSKEPLKPGSNPTEFILSLKLEPGYYRIALMAGTHSTSVNARVLGPISIQSFEIGLEESDGTSAPKLTKLSDPNKLQSNLIADSSQKLIVKFVLTRPVHQAFLRLSSINTKEVIFIAEGDTTNKNYKVDVHLATELSQSGTYDIELILGDSVVTNPIRWQIGKVEVTLGPSSTVAEPKKNDRGFKPEIKHLFRPAEKRPAEFISILFTLATLIPFFIMLIIWMKLGLNFKNFTTLSIPFHIGFGAILGLYTLFWLKLDMFTTCAWLIPIGGFTFLAGNKLLSHIARNRKPEKAEKQ